MRRPSIRHLVAGVVMGTVLLAGAVPTAAARPAGDASSAWSLDVRLGSPWIRGGGATKYLAVTVVQRRDGQVISTKHTTVAEIGLFTVTAKPVLGGDQIVITVGSTTRTTVVPDLRLSVDAATDVVKGRIPAGASDPQLYVHDNVGGFVLGGDNVVLEVSSTGTFQKDLTSEVDVTATGMVDLYWTRPSTGDRFLQRRVVPGASVQVGRAAVDVAGSWGRQVTATLRSPNGTLRGRATVRTLPETEWTRGRFRLNGSPVTVRARDVVTVAGVAGRLTLRRPDLEAVAASGGFATATCFPNRDWVLGHAFGDGGLSHIDDGTTGPGGAIAVAPLTEGGDPPSGYRVGLLCENAYGFVQSMVATVP